VYVYVNVRVGRLSKLEGGKRTYHVSCEQGWCTDEESRARVVLLAAQLMVTHARRCDCKVTRNVTVGVGVDVS
jgi:hypothetical protein